MSFATQRRWRGHCCCWLVNFLLYLKEGKKIKFEIDRKKVMDQTRTRISVPSLIQTSSFYYYSNHKTLCKFIFYFSFQSLNDCCVSLHNILRRTNFVHAWFCVSASAFYFKNFRGSKSFVPSMKTSLKVLTKLNVHHNSNFTILPTMWHGLATILARTLPMVTLCNCPRQELLIIVVMLCRCCVHNPQLQRNVKSIFNTSNAGTFPEIVLFWWFCFQWNCKQWIVLEHFEIFVSRL